MSPGSGVVIVGGMTPDTYEDLSAVILAADLERLWSWVVAEGLAEGAERDEFVDDEIRDMCLDYLDALTDAEAEAMRRAVSGA